MGLSKKDTRFLVFVSVLVALVLTLISVQSGELTYLIVGLCILCYWFGVATSNLFQFGE